MKKTILALSFACIIFNIHAMEEKEKKAKTTFERDEYGFLTGKGYAGKIESTVLYSDEECKLKNSILQGFIRGEMNLHPTKPKTHICVADYKNTKRELIHAVSAHTIAQTITTALNGDPIFNEAIQKVFETNYTEYMSDFFKATKRSEKLLYLFAQAHIRFYTNLDTIIKSFEEIKSEISEEEIKRIDSKSPHPLDKHAIRIPRIVDAQGTIAKLSVLLATFKQHKKIMDDYLQAIKQEDTQKISEACNQLTSNKSQYLTTQTILERLDQTYDEVMSHFEDF